MPKKLRGHQYLSLLETWFTKTIRSRLALCGRIDRKPSKMKGGLTPLKCYEVFVPQPVMLGASKEYRDEVAGVLSGQVEVDAVTSNPGKRGWYYQPIPHLASVHIKRYRKCPPPAVTVMCFVPCYRARGGPIKIRWEEIKPCTKRRERNAQQIV